MNMLLTENNSKKAFCEVLNCCGFGAAEYSNWENFINLKIKLSMNPDLLEGFLDKVFECTRIICTNEPYNWNVKNIDSLIEITDETTFEDVYEEVFKNLIND